VVAKVRERLAVSKQLAQTFYAERFNLKKLCELVVRKQYQIKISNRFVALENLNVSERGGHIWGRGEVHRILVGRPEGRRPFGRPRHRWEDNIKMDLQEVGWDGVARIDVTQDRDRWRAVVNAVMNLRVP
jgi:hypothetical protein